MWASIHAAADGVLAAAAAQPYLAGCIGLTVAWYFIDDVYLPFVRQRRVVQSAQRPPELASALSTEKFEQARAYNLDRINFGAWKATFNVVETVGMLVLGWLPFSWALSGQLISAVPMLAGSGEVTQSIVFLLINTLADTAIDLPWTIYHTFVLEARHGFNKQTPRFFAIDTVKKVVVGSVLASALTAGLLAVIEWAGDRFFAYAWGTTLVFSLFLMSVYPDYIAPLFDKYTPLPQGELRTTIENLAASVNFPLTQIFVVNGSRRSNHSNAYFYGFFKNKRIVLFDTLLPPSERPAAVDEAEEEKEKKEEEESKDEEPKKTGCSNDEIVAVLAHELGHWQFNHVLKMACMAQIQLLLTFYALEALSKNEAMYSDFGFVTAQPKLIGLLVVTRLLSPISAVLSIATTHFSRKFEFQADNYAKTLGRAYSLRQVLLKLNADNLGFPVSDPLYSAVNHSHPTLLERLDALQKAD
eukprot:m.159418 g.159418  ORF g.159418 m.159418 type:complete len:471 (-) comp17038_c0_seq3:2087-3499(-)